MNTLSVLLLLTLPAGALAAEPARRAPGDFPQRPVRLITGSPG